VKAETVDKDTSMSEAGLSTSAPVPKQPSLNDRLQKMIETGSPETLEAEVKRCQLFLENMKKPLLEEASRHKDAKHWLTQIGKNLLYGSRITLTLKRIVAADPGGHSDNNWSGGKYGKLLGINPSSMNVSRVVSVSSCFGRI
jgi:hypothetical protein